MVSFGAHGLPLIAAVAIWFVSTGAILWLDRRPRATYGTSLALLGAASIGALVAVAATAHDRSPLGAYVGFGAALTIWGWHEFAFLIGAVTGPRRADLPAGAQGLRRFRLAAQTVIHHEVALALTLLLIAALTWDAPNVTAAETFGLLFAMRLSTKLNIFIGVPNLSTDMLPAHLAYLKSYFRVRPAGLPFVASLIGLSALASGLGSRALGASEGEAVSASLAFALVALGLLEHLFLVMPIRDAALWRWASRA